MAAHAGADTLARFRPTASLIPVITMHVFLSDLHMTDSDLGSPVADAELKVYPGAPHGLFQTDKEQLNDDLLAFIKK